MKYLIYLLLLLSTNLVFAMQTGPLTSNGNVGIGSQNPGTMLDVNGTTRTIGFNMPTGENNNYVLTSDSNGNGTWKVSSGGGAGSSSLWETNSVGIDTFQPYVGIGSTNPGVRLDVQGSLRIIGGGVVSIGTSSNSKYLNIGTTDQATIDSSGNITTTAKLAVGNSSVGGDAITISGTNNEGMLIHSTVAADEAYFELEGDTGQFSGYQYLNSTNPGTNLSTLPNSLLMYADNNSTNGIVLDSYGNGPIIFGIGNNSTSFNTERMRILNSGNVGIGSVGPIQRLDVNGTVRMVGFSMPTSASNNYVLTTDSNGNGTWQVATGGTGTVTSVATDGTLTGGTITTTGTLGIASSTALPGSPTTTTQAVGDNSTKLATTAFVQSQISNQVDMHDPVQAATTAPLIFSPNYSNGSSGVGATLTATTVGVLIIDGYTPNLGDRLLIQNQSSSLQNGCYTVTTLGVVITTDYVLTRCTDFNQVSNIEYGDTFPVLQGTTNANQQFTMNNSSFTTVGAAGSTGNITFAQTSGGSQLSQGNNIVITGNSIATTLTPSFTTIKMTTTPTTNYVMTSSDSAGDSIWSIINTASVNWASINNIANINSSGLNWQNINGLITINNGSINWANINGLNPINTGGVNWNNIPSFVAGDLLSGIATNTVNWTNNIVVSGGSTFFNNGNVGIGTLTSGQLFVGANMGIGTFLPGERLDVEGGNVGIGTITATTDKFYVNGSMVVNGNIAGGTTGNIGIGTFAATATTCDSVCNTTNHERCFVALSTAPSINFHLCSATLTGTCLCLPAT